MIRLAAMLYSIIGTSFAGSFVIAALATGYDTKGAILVAAVAAAVLAVPACYYVARVMIIARR
jgi:hypothetical protein